MSAASRLKTLLLVSLLVNVLGVAAVLTIVQRKGGWSYLQFKVEEWRHPRAATPMANDGSYRNRVDLFHVLSQRGAKAEIVFAGDSHAEKGDWSLLLGRTVSNRGIGGETLEDFRQRLPDLLAQKPRLLILQIGSNDLDAQALPPARLQHLVDGYAALLDTLARDAPATRLIVTAILPTENEHASNGQLPLLNQRLLSLCASHPQCLGADASAALSDAAGNLRVDFSFDATHLNGAGYEAWAAVLKPLVDQTFAGSISIASP